jgi:outer membrane protein assembly factor BamA
MHAPAPRQRPRFLWALLVAVVTLATPNAAPAQADSAAAERPLVTQVSLRGVKSVDINQLGAGLATKGTRCKSPLYLPICWITRSPTFSTRHHLDPLEFRRDVLRIRLFYWQRGWRDAAVVARTERTSAGVRAIFDIEEKEPTVIRELRVTQTDSILPQRSIDRALQLKAGDPLDVIAMDSTVLMLRDELWERGHASAQIDVDTTQVSDVSNGGPVSITIRPGPLVRVSEIQFTGNQRVSNETIHRQLTFKAGDLFKRSDILGSQRNLYLSGLFSELDIDTPPAGDTLRLVRIRVVEADLNRIEVAGGLTTADFGQVDADFTRHNFFGSARRLTLRGTVSNLFAGSLNGQGLFYDVTNGATDVDRDRFLQPTWSASIDVLQPWLFSVHNQLGVSVFAHRRAVPGIVVERGRGASIAFTRDFGPRTNSTLGYTYELSWIDASDVYFCVSFGVCLRPTIDVLGRGNVLSPLASVTQFDVSNDPFTPDRGYRARVDVEHASRLTSSDFHYNRAELTGSTYHSVSRTAVLAFRARLGWVGALRGTNQALGLVGDDELVVHPRKRFYAGGSMSVRGFGERQLGPRVLTVSPTALTDTALATPCSSAQLADQSCDPNLAGLEARAFQPQPLGGSTLAEASVEYRFPLWPVHGISGAFFIDGAIIATRQLTDLLGATTAVTPGFGLRMNTPVGPVRLDLGIRPTLVENLPVVTQVTNPDGSVQLVTLTTLRRYDPLDTRGGFFNQVMSRLRLHLAIGPPF